MYVCTVYDSHQFTIIWAGGKGNGVSHTCLDNKTPKLLWPDFFTVHTNS